MGAKSTVLVVDDHPIVRDGLREMFSRQPDLRVAGEARTRQEALQACDKVEPDVAVVDLSLGQQTLTSLITASLDANHLEAEDDPVAGLTSLRVQLADALALVDGAIERLKKR